MDLLNFNVITSSVVVSIVSLIMRPRKRARQHYSIASALTLVGALLALTGLIISTCSFNDLKGTFAGQAIIAAALFAALFVWEDFRTKPTRKISFLGIASAILSLVGVFIGYNDSSFKIASLVTSFILTGLLIFILYILNVLGILTYIEKRLSKPQSKIDKKCPRLKIWNDKRKDSYDLR